MLGIRSTAGHRIWNRSLLSFVWAITGICSPNAYFHSSHSMSGASVLFFVCVCFSVMSAFFSHKNKNANKVKCIFINLIIYLFPSCLECIDIHEAPISCFLRTPAALDYLHLANVEQTVISFLYSFLTFDVPGGDVRSTHTLPHACAKEGVPPGSGSANPLQHPGG